MKNIPIRQLGPTRKEPASSGQFKIRRVEDILQGKDLIHHLHRHSFFFMLALQKGSGSHEIDFTNYKVQDNSVFFLRPGQVHQLELKAGSTGYLVEFDTEYYSPKDKSAKLRLRKASHKNYCPINSSRFKKLQAVLHSIYEEHIDREEGYQDVIKSSLDIVFIELVRQSPDPKREVETVNSYSQERFEEFSALLDKHITLHKQVSYYIDLMNLSAYQLNEITKSSIGKTVSELINERIILEAKRQLLATPNQVKDIADQLGYEDNSYFIRFFKKHTGQSPEAFRNNFK